MEYQFIAQQNIALYSNIFLGIFCVALVGFFITVFLASRDKKSVNTPVVMYGSLKIAVASFIFAILLSNYSPYDSSFTKETAGTMELSAYAGFAFIAVILVAGVIMFVRNKKKL